MNHTASPEIELRIENVSKRFGPIEVVKQCSFDVARGKITALVGSNGAGKTTTFNMISGVLSPTSGEISYRGESVVGLSQQRRAALGIGRTFQDLRLFHGLSARDNVAVAVQNQRGETLRNLFFRPVSSRSAEKRSRIKASDALAYVGLDDDRHDTTAANLSYGEQKLVSLARLIALDADLMLLDEPASGLDQSSVDKLQSVIQALITDGKTVLMVEHNMALVRRLCDWSVFLAGGEIIATGSPEVLMNDPQVQELYLGGARRRHADETAAADARPTDKTDPEVLTDVTNR